MQVAKGYKQTEVGVIPEDWDFSTAKNLCKVNQGLQISIEERLTTPSPHSLKYITIQYLNNSKNVEYIDSFTESVCCSEDDVLMTRTGNTGIVVTDVKGVFHNNFFKISYRKDRLVKDYFVAYLRQEWMQQLILTKAGTSTIPDLNHSDFYSIPVIVPPFAEQEAIAEALSDADSLIESLQQLIAKKRQIKQGAMQELLDPKDDWVEKSLGEISDCLDHLRVPLNGSEREGRVGDYPYCGANGILGYIDDFCVNDSVILIAEDGGYFDEYLHRPIAYRMTGKFWVNNHAHILKARTGIDQEYLFYNLVHKDIQKFLASGTRAKLNKSEMIKITIHLPPTLTEQTRIATILSDMDDEITTLETKLTKAQKIKQGMMSELLTGKTRLI